MLNKKHRERCMAITAINNRDKVQVEISSNLLADLLNAGLLHGGDCKCLNANAKAVIWHCLLASSTNIDDINGEHYLCA